MLPSLEVLTTPRECEHCGEPIRLIDPPFCAACDDRKKTEARIQSGNDYRRDAQYRLDMETVRDRTRRHLKRAPAQNVCVTCDGRGGFAGGQDDGKECPDCDGTGVPK